MDIVHNNNPLEPNITSQAPADHILHTYMETSLNTHDLVSSTPVKEDNEPVAYAESTEVEGNHQTPAEEYAYAYAHCSGQHILVSWS